MSEPIVAGFQLSPQQRRVWAMGMGDVALNAVAAVSIEGDLDSKQLRAALQQTVARHEILRTTFRRKPGMKIPVQVVQQDLPPAWFEVDLRSSDAKQQRPEVESLFRNQQQQAFPLEQGPMIRATLIALSQHERILLLVAPALVADDQSLNNIVAEMSRAYSNAPLEEEVFQYADYSGFANELLESEDHEAATGKRYWKELLSDVPPLAKLPFESKPSQPSRSQAQKLAVSIDSTFASIPEYASFLAASWAVLLGRLSGQGRIAITYLSDGRNHDEVASAIGPFARTLPLVCDVDSDSSFKDIQNQMRSLIDKASSYQDYFSPENAHPEPSFGFSVSKLPKHSSAGNLSFSMQEQKTPAGQFHLQLQCGLVDDGCKATIIYDPQYFSAEAARRIAEHLSILLKSATRNPDARICDLEIMSEAEQHQVTIDFNRTVADYPKSKTVHELFEEMAATVPDLPALRCDEQTLNYAELNARANQLAHLLRKNGVNRGAFVPLCLDRSADMIVALLAVLKAGGAYVPLVPDNPKARLAQQLSDLQARALISEKKFLANLPDFVGTVLQLDDAALANEPSANPDPVTSPSDVAYVIYTSGSTGVPKGVEITHRNLVNYSNFMVDRLQARSGALNFATVSTLAADLGNTAIFPALISGGCLHVIRYDTSMSAEIFGQYAKKHPIDVLKITPSHLHSLLASPHAPEILPRKYLIVGGEAARWEMISQIRTMGKCAIINHYGPTETTIGCCTFSVNDDVRAWAPATVPIGKPISNAQTYILDQQLRPVPVGVPGELCIGGAGVAKGYLNRPEQTAEKFVRDPFATDPGARLYRSGDLARYLPDGNIEFLGRIDQQVKIRGFRVEPAEIEAVLKQNRGVQQAVVMPHEDRSGDKRLVAYVVARANSSQIVEELRSELQQRLPDYMVPAAIICLDTFPLTKNGKLDVAALPSPEEAAVKRSVLAARNPVEQGLVDIWRQVLGIDQVGVEDNLFDLGGHSLLATQVISRIRTAFHVQLPLRSLFDSPTVAGLAAQIAALPQSSEDDEVARLLKELEGISDEEAERLLAEEMGKSADSAATGNS